MSNVFIKEHNLEVNPWTPSQMWEAALGSLELQVSRASYSTWLKGTVGLSWDGGQMVIGTPSSFVAEWLERRMSSLVENTLSQIAGSTVSVHFQVLMAPSSPLDSSQQGPHEPVQRAAIQANGSTNAKGNGSTKLNSKYTLESFIVGESNQFAYAAAVAVSSRPGKAYNPLFLSAGVGLGKTHLLHAIGNASSSNGLRCLYVTSEQFTNDFITSIQTKKTRDFRDRYRSVDVLLVDDIQFFRGKDSIQEGFFHTFNDLHNTDRQIVIASDRPSSELSLLEDRLRSRFEWGLSAEMTPPNYETRLAILRAKAAHLDISIPDDVLAFLSQTFRHSVRDLEGALNRVSAFSDLIGQPLTMEMAHHALGDMIKSPQQTTPSIEAVLSQVCSFFDVSLPSLSSNRRDKRLTTVRQVAIYLLREEAQMTLVQIGQTLGGRDHTSIRYAHHQLSSKLGVDATLKSDVESIRTALQQAKSP